MVLELQTVPGQAMFLASNGQQILGMLTEIVHQIAIGQNLVQRSHITQQRVYVKRLAISVRGD